MKKSYPIDTSSEKENLRKLKTAKNNIYENTSSDLPIDIIITDKLDESFLPKKIGTGPITESNDGGFIINPKSPFPLTIMNISRSDAKRLKSYLDRDAIGKPQIHQITFLLALTKSKCKEIEEYIKIYKPHYLSLIYDFNESAIKALDIRPYDPNILRVLFDENSMDINADDNILQLFNDDATLYMFYMSNLRNLGRIDRRPGNDYYRNMCERLVKIGLADRVQDLTINEILDPFYFSLKDINELLHGLVKQPFKKKKDAIEYALSVANLKEFLPDYTGCYRINKPVCFNFNNSSKSYKYTSAIATLIRDTYRAGYETIKYLNYAIEDRCEDYEIYSTDCCPYCDQFNCVKVKGMSVKLPPFHIGCNCELRTVSNNEITEKVIGSDKNEDFLSMALDIQVDKAMDSLNNKDCKIDAIRMIEYILKKDKKRKYVDLYSLLAEHFIEKGDYKSGYKYGIKAASTGHFDIASLKRMSDKIGVKNDKYNNNVIKLLRKRELFILGKEKYNWNTMYELQGIAWDYIKLCQYDEATRLINRAIEIAQQLEKTSWYSYSMIARMNFKQEKYKEAIFFYMLVYRELSLFHLENEKIDTVNQVNKDIKKCLEKIGKNDLNYDLLYTISKSIENADALKVKLRELGI